MNSPVAPSLGEIVRTPWVESGRVPSLDGLRAVAIGLVLISHAVPRSQGSNWDRWIGQLGGVGVDVFFVISGFLITLLLLRELDRTGGVDLNAFYWRRALRILPAYWIFLTCMGALVVSGYERVPASDFAAAFGYVMNFTPVHGGRRLLEHSWSLSVEEHFYLVWPWIFAMAGRRISVRILMGAMAISAAFRHTMRMNGINEHYDVSWWTPARMDVIAGGCLLAYLVTSSAAPRWMAKVSRHPTLIILRSLASIVISKVVLCRVSYRYSFTFDRTTTTLAITMIVLACVSASLTAFGKILNTRADHDGRPVLFPLPLAAAVLDTFSLGGLEEPLAPKLDPRRRFCRRLPCPRRAPVPSAQGPDRAGPPRLIAELAAASTLATGSLLGIGGD